MVSHLNIPDDGFNKKKSSLEEEKQAFLQISQRAAASLQDLGIDVTNVNPDEVTDMVWSDQYNKGCMIFILDDLWQAAMLSKQEYLDIEKMVEASEAQQ
ncbi:MAG: hypothetical protein Ta2E_03840 [Mycoplasmoidaceae bacterium]|nr:MAG: hypothetical protein Ta2E_03840 [Mycoplasmoidaceae bacterium]